MNTRVLVADYYRKNPRASWVSCIDAVAPVLGLDPDRVVVNGKPGDYGHDLAEAASEI